MGNLVSDKFIRYLKRIRKQSGIKAKDLASVAGKTPPYISHIENGTIKTIDYDVAYRMLQYINDKSYLIVGRISDNDKTDHIGSFLQNNFNIHPKDYWDSIAKEEEERNQAFLENIKQFESKITKLTSVAELRHEYIIDFAIKLIELDEDDEESFNKINYIDELYELAKISHEDEGGIFNTFYMDLQKLLKKYKKEE